VYAQHRSKHAQTGSASPYHLHPLHLTRALFKPPPPPHLGFHCHLLRRQLPRHHDLPRAARTSRTLIGHPPHGQDLRRHRYEFTPSATVHRSKEASHTTTVGSQWVRVPPPPPRQSFGDDSSPTVLAPRRNSATPLGNHSRGTCCHDPSVLHRRRSSGDPEIVVTDPHCRAPRVLPLPHRPGA
jgi:hypothetical protein